LGSPFPWRFVPCVEISRKGGDWWKEHCECLTYPCLLLYAKQERSSMICTTKHSFVPLTSAEFLLATLIAPSDFILFFDRMATTRPSSAFGIQSVAQQLSQRRLWPEKSKLGDAQKNQHGIPKNRHAFCRRAIIKL
jgi:hypothetical protein